MILNKTTNEQAFERIAIWIQSITHKEQHIWENTDLKTRQTTQKFGIRKKVIAFGSKWELQPSDLTMINDIGQVIWEIWLRCVQCSSHRNTSQFIRVGTVCAWLLILVPNILQLRIKYRPVFRSERFSVIWINVSRVFCFHFLVGRSSEAKTWQNVAAWY